MAFVGEYVKAKVFSSGVANSACDLLFLKLWEKFPLLTEQQLQDAILLSGRAAMILQAEMAPKALDNIVFFVNEGAHFYFLRDNVEKIFRCRVVKFKNRFFFYVGGIHFEVENRNDDKVTSGYVDNIRMVLTADIPANIQ